MDLKEFLKERRPGLVKRWFEMTAGSYPPDTSKFLSENKGRFANPVGTIMAEGLDGLFAGLIEGADEEKLHAPLEGIIKVRAVQDFTASGAVAFIIGLKSIVREELQEIGEENFADLLRFEDRVDRLALQAFDIFMKCREKVYDLKANEVRNMTFRLLERVNELSEKERPASAGNGNKEQK